MNGVGVMQEERKRGGKRRGEGRSTCKRRVLLDFSLYTHARTLYSPIEIERGGRKREILHDHNDMYILHLSKNLVT